MIDETLILEACEARADLERVFAECAAALSQMSEVMAVSADAVKHAVAREVAATGAYVAALERALARAQHEHSGAELN